MPTQVAEGNWTDWKAAGFTMCFNALQMVCLLKKESVDFDMVKGTLVTCGRMNEYVEQLLPSTYAVDMVGEGNPRTAIIYERKLRLYDGQNS
mmetsp:Transcript_14115/g.23885  ORF Transcript_14115/g.23885 Transcript_14115/m.23885 type:complete len:92 (+) Transcript_14115:282-557(+)